MADLWVRYAGGYMPAGHAEVLAHPAVSEARRADRNRGDLILATALENTSREQARATAAEARLERLRPVVAAAIGWAKLSVSERADAALARHIDALTAGDRDWARGTDEPAAPATAPESCEGCGYYAPPSITHPAACDLGVIVPRPCIEHTRWRKTAKGGG